MTDRVPVKGKGTFKYHMTLWEREGVCSNRQSTVIWEEGSLAKLSYNFYSVQKNLILRFLLLYFWYLWGERLVENVIWVEGLAENVRKTVI